jgi:hypothetical protein
MDTVKCYIYPYELTSRDKLADGPEGTSFDITADTLLVWVDLQPEMRFAHPTLYVLISAVKTRVEKGEWWPELNGRRILYGCRNPVAVLSPFELEMPAPQN